MLHHRIRGLGSDDGWSIWQAEIMIIVAGHLRVVPEARQGYLDDCREIIEAARVAKGCHDFHLSADPLEPDRINVYEAWSGVAEVDAFRGAGPAGPQADLIASADVMQYEVTSATSLT